MRSSRLFIHSLLTPDARPHPARDPAPFAGPPRAWPDGGAPPPEAPAGRRGTFFLPGTAGTAIPP